MAGDGRQAVGARVQAHPDEHAPDAVLADPKATPLLAGQLGRDPAWPEARVRQGERDDPLLDVRSDLVGHPWAPALTHIERFKAPAVDLALEAVIR